MIKGVIFDLDGTILNTLDDLAAAMNSMLSEFGYPERRDLFYHSQALGFGARSYVKSCMPEEAAADEAKVDACLERYRVLYGAASSVLTKPYDGICELMDALRAADISINVLSNKPNAPTQALVQKWFSAYEPRCVYGERSGIPRKPDPAAPLAIAAELGLLPQEMAFVGDSEVDIKTGLAAGMLSVGVLWGYRTKEQLLENGAMHLIQTPQELMALIQSN